MAWSVNGRQLELAPIAETAAPVLTGENPKDLRQGANVESGPNADIAPGNCLPLSAIPTGTTVHNVELLPGRGGQLGRSAGAAIQLVAKEGKYATLRLPSGEMRMVLTDCRATIGVLGNAEHELVDLGKAGRSRHRGKRPQTRGVAMNHHRKANNAHAISMSYIAV